MHPKQIRPALVAAFLLLVVPGAATPEPPSATAPADLPAVPSPSDQQAPDPMPIPPGSPEDQALWRRAVDDGNGIALSRANAAKLQWRARDGKYEERLLARATGQEGAEAERTKDLARRVKAAWQENSEISGSRWPVDPTRGCQYQAQQLESAMQVAPGPERSAALVPARADVTRCVELAERILGRMNGSNAALEKVLAEADAALAAR
jgi:hypothetical protein